MDELVASLTHQNIHDICVISARYLCQNKLKQILNLVIHEFSNNYLNTHLCSVVFLHSRLQKIVDNMNLKGQRFTYQNRIIRICVCELFVYLAQIPRSPINDVPKVKEPVNPVSYSPHVIFHVPYVIKNSYYVDIATYMDILLSYYIDEPDINEKLRRLLYCLSTKDFESIRTHLQWLVQRTRSTSLTNNIHLEDDMVTDSKWEQGTIVKNQNDFVWLLFFITIRSAPDRLKIWCKRLMMIYFTNFTKSVKSTRMNLLYLAYQIAISADQFEHIFDDTNRFYNKIVLQCALKIDFIYEEMAERYGNIDLCREAASKKGKMEPSSGGNVPPNESTINEGTDLTDSTYYEQVLFSAPIKDKMMALNLKQIVQAYKTRLQREGDWTKKTIRINSSKSICAQ